MSNLKLRVELCRLIIARDSMETVAEASGLALALKIDATHQLYMPLHDRVVSSYGRAFTEMRPLGFLSKKWSKFDDDELKKIHHKLIYFRNKNVGHTDFIKGRVTIYPKGTQREDGVLTENVECSVLFQAFVPADLVPIQKLAGSLAGRLMIEIDQLMTKLYGHQGKDLKAATDLITEDELEQLRLARKNNWWLKLSRFLGKR